MRLLWWVGALVAGMATALVSKVSAELWALVALLPGFGAYVLVRKDRRVWAEGIVFCCLGLYVGARALDRPPLPPAFASVVDTDRKVRAQGWALTAAEPAPPRAGSRLRVAVERVDGRLARATVALAVAAGTPELWPGDLIEFDARLRSVRGLANPGVPDAAIQARASGVDLFAGVGAAAAIRKLDAGAVAFAPGGFAPVLRAAARLRVEFGRAIDAVATGQAASFLHTAVLGERRATDPQVEAGFRAAGATHVLSVSGLHLAAVALMFFAGVRGLLAAIPRLPLWIEPRATAAIVALPAITFYTLITGSAVATIRSALMMGFGLVGLAIGRRSTPVVAVAAAVLVLLAWSPLVLADISFQLSVVSVLALAVLVPRLMPDAGATGGAARASIAMAGPGWLGRPVRWLSGFAAATVAAGITTAPIVAHYFGEVTPAAPLGNLVLVPLVEMVVVPFGLLGAAIGATLGRTCSLPVLTVAEVAARAALAAAELFRNHAPVWLTRSPNLFETVSLCIGFGCVAATLRRRQAFGAWILAAGVVWISAAAISLAVREIARRWNQDVIVTFLDVGQGDAALVELPGGRTLLIDGGGTYDGSFDPGARVVEPFLRARGITHLDLVALSHPHPDHMGGLHRIVDRFEVQRLWTSGDDGRNPDYLRLLTAARARGVALPVPAPWEVGGATVEPVGPYVLDGRNHDSERIGVPEGTTVNDASLVIRVTYRGRAVLFTGDIEENGEGELAGRVSVGQDVASDVLKVPHHGSRTSSTDELLDAVRPRIAVISLGWRNRFNFPRPEVVERYRRRGARLLRTDLHGAVTVRLTAGGQLATTCERGCR